MLPAAARLRRRVDFTETVRRGRRVGRGALVVHVQFGPSVPGTVPREPPRVGFVVGKAVGGSVVRNLVLRRLRHLVRDRLDRIPPGARLVIRARPSAAEVDYPQLERDLDGALNRVLKAA